MILRSIVLLWLSLPLAGCLGPSWDSVDAEMSLGQAWREFNGAAVARGFRTDLGATDHGLRTYRSTWKPKATGELGRRGRVRLHGKITPVDGQTGFVKIEYYVERQNVEDLAKVNFPTEEDYCEDGQDVIEQRYVGQNLRARLDVDQLSQPLIEPGT
ncbi:MAG: hypothetical protein AAF196_13580 [Planctomycetota bacterium]